MLNLLFSLVAPRRRQRKRPHKRLLDRAAFWRCLERERYRADRTGRSFALLVFTLGDKHHDAAIRGLDKALAERLRLTDDAGFFDARRVAVVLPEANEHGARRVADDVLAKFTPRWGELPWRAQVYPASAQPPRHNDRGDNDRGEHSDSPERKAGSAAHADQDSAAATPEQSRAPRPRARDEASAAGSTPVELSFARPTPLWKRACDVVGALGLLAAASPVLLTAAIAIKATSRGPVLFTQRRAGLGGKPFVIYKLRTMCDNAEAQKAALRQHSEQDGPAFKISNDPRVTKVGWLLRRTCVDELPQLWNVLRGDMSLVGPRPLPVDEAAKCDSWQQRRLDVAPGLTCIWQAAGGAKKKISFADWMRMDLRYISSRFFLHDARLLWRTAVAVALARAST